MALIACFYVAMGLDHSGKISFSSVLGSSLFAFPVALILTALFGLLVEWPKAKWMIHRNQDGKLMGLFLSMLIAVILSNIQTLVAVDSVNPPSKFVAYALFADIIVALIGGSASAYFWWHLVIAPERKKRSVPVVAAQFA